MMGGDDATTKQSNIQEQKAAIWEQAQGVIRSMEQFEAEIQNIRELKREKWLRLDELKHLEQRVDKRISDASSSEELESAKAEKASLHSEHDTLFNEIKSDLSTIRQLVAKLTDLKEQDLELATKAEAIADHEMQLLDLRRQSIHTSRKVKQQIIQKRRSSEQGDWTSFLDMTNEQTNNPVGAESLSPQNKSYFDTFTKSPISDQSKGARSKTRYSQLFYIPDDDHEKNAQHDYDAPDPRDVNEDDTDDNTFSRFAKMMGDNLIALRKIQERPPNWNGPRIKVYSGKPKNNIDDFEDGIRSSCVSLNISSDKDKIRYMKGFLDGDAADFASTLSRSGQYSLNEIFVKLKERFKDNRSQTDFLYMFTMRRQDPNTESIRQYSHDLYNLVSKAYPSMPDAQRMEVLKQKFLSSIKVEDFEKTAMSHDPTTTTFSQVVNIMARVEEFRKTKEKCQQKINDDWYLNNLQQRDREYTNRRFYNNRRGGYRPWNQETRQCHYCHVVGHIAYKCHQRLEDRRKGIEREIEWPPQKNEKKSVPISAVTITLDRNVPRPLTTNRVQLFRAYLIQQWTADITKYKLRNSILDHNPRKDTHIKGIRETRIGRITGYIKRSRDTKPRTWDLHL